MSLKLVSTSQFVQTRCHRATRPRMMSAWSSLADLTSRFELQLWAQLLKSLALTSVPARLPVGRN